MVGVCYGMLGDNLPSPREVVKLYEKHNIRSMRLYKPDHDALKAIQKSHSEIRVMIGVANEEIPDISSSQASADKWVRENIIKYANNGVTFKYIAVGNEIDIQEARDRRIAPHVHSAMEKIQIAISEAGLANEIKVSTAIFDRFLQDAWPPSDSVYRPHYREYLKLIIHFLLDNQSPLLVNLYPYFGYNNDKINNTLDYALFRSREVVVRDVIKTVRDEKTFKYKNLFDAMLDAHYVALSKVANVEIQSLKIVVSETGWPSAGGDRGVTTLENARVYNSKLIEHVNSDTGTPRRPGEPIETYIFAMFNENQKHGAQTERHFGLFDPVHTRTPLYPINFNA